MDSLKLAVSFTYFCGILRSLRKYKVRLNGSWKVVFVVFAILVLSFSGCGKNTDPASNGKIKAHDPHFSSAGLFESYPDQWALHRIGINSRDHLQAATLPDGTDSVIVAFVDSGLDYKHPDYSPSALWRNPNEELNGKDDDGNGYVDDLIGWNFVEHDNNPWDDFGHGTMMAGIIGAEVENGLGIAGMVPGIKIMPLKVFNFFGKARSHKIAEAIVYAVQNGATVICLGDVAHLTEAEKMAISHAEQAGVVIVATNPGNLTELGFSNLITVGASDSQDRPVADVGASIPDILAPGADVLSLRARRTDFVLVSGEKDYVPGQNFVGPENMFYHADRSSFSAAFVAGAVAMLQVKSPDFSPRQIKEVLRYAARPIGSSTELGVLDAMAALHVKPGYWIDARIEVTENEGKLVVQGLFHSDQVQESWLEFGEGTEPKEWKPLSLQSSETSRLVSILGRDDIPESWSETSFRLVVVHGSGMNKTVREVWPTRDFGKENQQ